MITWTQAKREPFRVLFPIGTLLGCLGVGHWLAYAARWTEASSGSFHAFLQVGGYMYGFIAGFLMTALPRFSSTPPASTAELAGALAALAGYVLCLSFGWWAASLACFIALLVQLGAFAARRVAARRGGDAPAEFVWIPIGLLLGIAGAGMMMARELGGAPVWVSGTGRVLAQQGFLLSIVVGVAGFMAPRLLGRGGLPVRVDPGDPRWWTRPGVRMAAHAAAGASLAASGVLEGAGMIRPAYALRAAVVTAELAWTTQCWRPPAVPEGYARLVWVSLWAIMGGLWAAAWQPAYRVAMLHVVFLGGFSLMAFAVATMVVMSHSGEGLRLRNPLWIIRLLGVALGAALIARLCADLVPAGYFHALGTAAGAWLLGALAWLWFALPRLLRAPDAGAFESAHAEATVRLERC
ncbi:MAG TPA: NnrS family protein [bacterium]